MATVFTEVFDGGTVGQPFTLAQVAYSELIPAYPVRAAGQTGQSGVALLDGAAGSGYFQQNLPAAATVRTLSRDVTIDTGTHTAGNAVLLEASLDGAVRAQVTLRASGGLGIRGGSNGTTLVAETPSPLQAGRIYRLVWSINGTTQTLQVTDRSTGTVVATITGAAVGGGFNRLKEGFVSNPTGSVKLTLDRALDDNTATITGGDDGGTTDPPPTTGPSGSVFAETFDAGTAGQPVTGLAYAEVIPTAPVYATAPTGLAALFAGPSGAGYLQQNLATATATRTLSRVVSIDAGTHAAGNLIVLQAAAATTPRGEVTLRTSGKLALRQASTLRKESTTVLTAGTRYRLEWTLDGTRQMLRIYTGTTLLETLTADLDGGGFDRIREGLVNDPVGTLRLTLDDAVDYPTATTIAPEPGAALAVNAGADQSVAAGAAVTLTAAASGGTGPYSYAWAPVTSGAPPLTGSGASRQLTGPTSSTASSWTYRVAATDAAGATATDDVVVKVAATNAAPSTAVPAGWVEVRLFTPTPGLVDTQPPVVAITGPAAGTLTPDAVVRLTGTATDDLGISQVEIRVDGQPMTGGVAYATVDAVAGTWTYDWDTSKEAAGTRVVTAVARDVTGRTATSAARGYGVSRAGAAAQRVAGDYGPQSTQAGTFTLASDDGNITWPMPTNPLGVNEHVPGSYGWTSETFRDVRDAPLHPTSAAQVAELVRQVKAYSGGTAYFNIGSFDFPVYTIGPNVPATSCMGFRDWQLKGYVPSVLYTSAGRHFRNVPLDGEMEPPDGTDSVMLIHQPITDSMWDYWKAYRDMPGDADEYARMYGVTQADAEAGDFRRKDHSLQHPWGYYPVYRIPGKYKPDSACVPTTANGRRYRVVAAGTDGQVWAASTLYGLRDSVRPTTSNGHQYRLVAIDSTKTGSGTTQPTWPTAAGATVVDGAYTWQEDGAPVATVKTVGLTGTTEPTWPTATGGQVADGAILWQEAGTPGLGDGFPGLAAVWGGRLENASISHGYFPDGVGQSAAGYATSSMCISVRDGWRAKRDERVGPHNLAIPHCVGFFVYKGRSGEKSWPAQRTDGWGNGTEFPEYGTKWRLKPGFDIGAHYAAHPDMSKLCYHLMETAKVLGLFPHDGAGVVNITGEAIPHIADFYAADDTAGRRMPWYAGPDDNGQPSSAYGAMTGFANSNVLKYFPWDQLEVCAHDLGKPGSGLMEAPKQFNDGGPMPTDPRPTGGADTTAPATALTSPAAGSTTGRTVDFEWSVS